MGPASVSGTFGASHDVIGTSNDEKLPSPNLGKDRQIPSPVPIVNGCQRVE